MSTNSFLKSLTFFGYCDFVTLVYPALTGLVSTDAYVMSYLPLSATRRLMVSISNCVIRPIFFSINDIIFAFRGINTAVCETTSPLEGFCWAFVDTEKVLKLSQPLVGPWRTLPPCVWVVASHSWRSWIPGFVLSRWNCDYSTIRGGHYLLCFPQYFEFDDVNIKSGSGDQYTMLSKRSKNKLSCGTDMVQWQFNMGDKNFLANKCAILRRSRILMLAWEQNGYRMRFSGKDSTVGWHYSVKKPVDRQGTEKHVDSWVWNDAEPVHDTDGPKTVVKENLALNMQGLFSGCS